MSWQRTFDQIQDIADDRTRGARELVVATARAIGAGVPAEPVEDVSELTERLAAAVLAAQPEMAPFRHLAAALLRSRDLEALADAMEAFVSRVEESRLDERAGERIEGGATVVTYSRSGSVMGAIVAALRAGRAVRVLVGEGRPGYEGRSLASALAAEGAAVEVMTDAGLMARARAVGDLVLVGADAVGRGAVRNKVGTRALCRVAREAGTPVYVLADETKFLPADLWPDERERDPAEVWAEPPSGVGVRNPYFESVPLSEITALITGDGPLTGEALTERIEDVLDEVAIVRERLGR